MAQQLAEGTSALTPTPPADPLTRLAAESSPEKSPSKVVLRKFRPDIEGLRAIAIITVVLGHAALGLPGGYVGVDVFFVISGFLITRQLVEEHEKRGRISFAGFYARRARRILPAATLVTVVTLIAAYLFVSPLRFPSVVHDGIAAALFSVNWHLAAQATNYFHASAPPSPFQHYWSLSVEEQFYVVWPLLLTLIAFLVRRRLGGHRKPLIVVLIVAIATSLWTSIHVTAISAPFAYFGTHTRVWELALGALIAVVATELHRIPRPAAAVFGWAGVAAIALACAAYSDKTPYPGSAALLPVLGAGLVIAAGCGEAPRFGPEMMLKQRPMQLGGLLSYSLYLWHWPLLVLLPQALGHPLSAGGRLLAVAAAIALSAATYLLVENPMRHARTFIVKPHRAAGLATALISASVITAFAAQSFVFVPASSAATSTPSVAATEHKIRVGKTGSDSVTQAVTEAANMTALPDAVAPPLPDAPNDFPDTHGCEVTDLAPAPKLPCSQFGDVTSHRRVVLIGDSHAGMWLDGLDTVAKSKHWRLTVFTKNGCSVGAYPGLIDTTRNRLYTECTSWRHAVIDRVRRMHPNLVVIGSEGRPIAARHTSGLTDSIRQLKRSGARIAFLADTPSPRSIGPIPDCLAENPGAIDRCAIPRAHADQSGGGRSAEIAAARAAGAHVIDPTPWFCTYDTCPAVIQDVVVYADASHITGSYGMLRAPQLSAALSRLMAKT